MRIGSLFLALTAWFLAISPLAADDRQVVVVELFTSQGCSSCPPADELVRELAVRDDVLPLALHVDYWDYIGWADTFARAEHTRRQKDYAREAGHRSIYTPQMVVAGVDHVIGYKPMKLADLLQAHRADMGKVGIAAEITDDNTLSVRVWRERNTGLPGRIVVDLVGFAPMSTVKIERGENAGRTIAYANVVESWERLGNWDGTGEWEGEHDLPQSGAFALIVQEAGPKSILAAMRVR